MIDSVKASNPSFLTVSPNKKWVYAINEDAADPEPKGTVSSYAFNGATGKLNFINQQKTNGNNPCYVGVNTTGNWLFVGNYTSGNLSILPVDVTTGLIDTAVVTIQHKGSSVNKNRQNAPHVHATVLSKNNRWLLVPDLGTDQLMLYRFNNKNGTLQPAPQPYVRLVPGSGPRHLSFSHRGKHVYLLQELTGSIAAYRFSPKKGNLQLIQQIAAFPDGFTGFAGSADIHVSPDGKFLYASNRGESNTIATFAINRRTGQLTKLSVDAVLGLTPRNFSIHPSGKFVLVANQNSHEVVVLARNPRTGLLTDTGNRLQVSKPVCLKWVLP
jgi:6-phosphogluconolactonase